MREKNQRHKITALYHRLRDPLKLDDEIKWVSELLRWHLEIVELRSENYPIDLLKMNVINPSLAV